MIFEKHCNDWVLDYAMIGCQIMQWLGARLCNDWVPDYATIGSQIIQWLVPDYAMIGSQIMQWLGPRLCNDWIPDYAMIRSQIMQGLGPRLCKDWIPDYARIGSQIMQWLGARLVRMPAVSVHISRILYWQTKPAFKTLGVVVFTYQFQSHKSPTKHQAALCMLDHSGINPYSYSQLSQFNGQCYIFTSKGQTFEIFRFTDFCPCVGALINISGLREQYGKRINK